MAMKEWKLPPEAKAELLQSQREFHDALPLMDKMEECGINCVEFRRVVKEGQERVDKILRNFG